MKPKFSIILSSFNYEKYIKETIESVINQTYQDWELIIVDDGSKDNSVEIIKSYCEKDDRIKLFQHPKAENKGIRDTILLGVKNTKHDWLVFLESDDIFEKNNLEEKAKVVEEEKDVKFIFNDFTTIGNLEFENRNWCKFFRNTIARRKGFYDYSFDLCKFNCIPSFSVVTMRKELLKGLDFNSPRKECLDFYLWVQIAQKTKFYFLEKKLTLWRQHNDSYLKRAKKVPYYLFFLKLSLFAPKLLKYRFGRTLMIYKSIMS